MPGLGTEAGESRRYVPGDDPRRIDWNVTARTQAPHVRDAIAEREVESWLVVDLSPSTDFGTARCTKRDLVVGAAGAPGPARRRGPATGSAPTCSRPDGIATRPAPGGRRRTPAPCSTCSPRRLGRPGGAAPPRPRRRRRPRPARPWHAAAAGWRRGRVRLPGHGRAGFPDCGRSPPATRRWRSRCSTPASSTCPTSGCWSWPTPRPGSEREVRTGDAGLRRRYAEAARAQREATAATMRALAVDHVVLRTDRDATADLVGWIARRPRRLGHLRRQHALGAAHGGR